MKQAKESNLKLGSDGFLLSTSSLNCDSVAVIPIGDARHVAVYRMPTKTYRVCLKPPSSAVQHVIAAEIRMLDTHLAFLDAKGDVAALFLVDLVKRWDEIPSR